MRRVDRYFGARYYRARRAGLIAVLLLSMSCSARTGELGTIDPGAEQAAVVATQLRTRLRVVFSWTLQDRDARFTGDGAARIEPPNRARLDLFGPRGEGYLSAALVDFELRLRPGAMADLLPPPTLLWSVIGVFRPPQNAELVGARADSTSMELQYRTSSETWRFHLRAGKLMSAEWQGPEQGRQTVEITGYDPHGVPNRAVYRDWRAFRELTLTLTQVHEVDAPFPPETWIPGVR